MLIAAACSGSGSDGPNFASAHPRVYLTANKDRLKAALAAQEPAAMRFAAMVDSWVGGANIYAFPAWNAALMGQLTGDPKYCTAAVAAVDQTVAMTQTAISSGSPPQVASDDYLQVGDIIGDLALTYDWCYSAIPSDRRTAWLAFAQQAVTNVWNPTTASWGGKAAPWSGWAIDDPADNYYYSFLRATMLLGLAAHGEVDGADAWLTQFHDTKLMGELVPEFDRDLVGGGSREGTGYGVSLRGLWDLYDIWQASTGETIADKTTHTRASMLAMTHQIVPTLDRVAPTGDQSRDSTASLFDYHRNYLQELVALFPSDPVAPRVQALLAGCSVPKMSEQFMFGYDFLYDDSSVAPTALAGLGTAYYAPGIGQLYARSGWDTHATWLDVTAGPYTQSHAHQDQGALLLYKDGWLVYDAVIDSHSGLPQQVDVHSTMRLVDSGTTVAQKLGPAGTVLALHAGTGYVHEAADLTPLYAGAAGVTSVQREVVYLEPDTVVVYDRTTTSGTVAQNWQLALPASPTIAGAQATMTAAGHTLTIARASGPAGVNSQVYSFATDSDFTNGFRLDEAAPPGDARWLHVLTIDGAATNITATDGNTVQLMLASGPVTVAFNPSSVGATLTLGGSTITLGAGVDTLPE